MKVTEIDIGNHNGERAAGEAKLIYLIFIDHYQSFFRSDVEDSTSIRMIDEYGHLKMFRYFVVVIGLKALHAITDGLEVSYGAVDFSLLGRAVSKHCPL